MRKHFEGSKAVNGTRICERNGMTCVDAPVLTPPEAACLVFHPGTEVTSSVNGWKQGIYCDNNKGLACQNQTSCHSCPACRADGLNCGQGASDQIQEFYIECACPTP